MATVGFFAGGGGGWSDLGEGRERGREDGETCECICSDTTYVDGEMCGIKTTNELCNAGYSEMEKCGCGFGCDVDDEWMLNRDGWTFNAIVGKNR